MFVHLYKDNKQYEQTAHYRKQELLAFISMVKVSLLSRYEYAKLLRLNKYNCHLNNLTKL